MEVFKIALICMMVVACFVPAQSYRRPSDSNISNELDETEEHQSLIPSISSFPVGWISKAPTYLLQFFDLKLRFIKFITSLFTTDNLTLMKKFLNISLRFGTWLYDINTGSTTGGINSFLSYLFPEMNPKEDLSQVPLSGTESDDSSPSFHWYDDYNTVDENENDETEEYGEQVMDWQSLINARSSF